MSRIHVVGLALLMATPARDATAHEPLVAERVCGLGFVWQMEPRPETSCEIDGRDVTLRTDTDADGTWDSVQIVTYDDRAHPTSERVLDGEGNVLWCRRMRHNRAGQLVRDRIDDGCDGTTDQRQVATFTAEGYPLTERTTTRTDGDSLVTWEYDEAGNRRRIVYDYSDTDDYPDTTCEYDPPCPPPFDTCWQVERCFETAVGP